VTRMENKGCTDSAATQTPALTGLKIGPGIRFSGVKFLLSPPGCCSQTVLPFWAKIIGTIENQKDEEILAEVKVSLVDASGGVLGVYSDVLAVDAGKKAEFDVRLTEFRELAIRYSIEIGCADVEKLLTSFPPIP
jgi:hypothetical protein